MPNIIPSKALHESFDRQCRLLKIEHEDLAPVIDALRGRFDHAIGIRDLSDEKEMQKLCGDLDGLMARIFPSRTGKRKGESSETQKIAGVEITAKVSQILRRMINDARDRLRRQLERDSGWDRDRMEYVRNLASSRCGRDIGPDPSEQSPEEVLLQQVPQGVRSAYRNMVEEWGLNSGVLYLLLRRLYKLPELDDETESLLSDWIGSCTAAAQPTVLPELPPEVLTDPYLAWFREVLFNTKRDQLLPTFANEGVLEVWGKLDDEWAALEKREVERLSVCQNLEEQPPIKQEFALKRTFLNALMQYFLEIEELPVPKGLRREIRGRAFPDRQQKTAAYETLNFGGRIFNGGRTGSGKTGATIYTMALGMQQGSIKKVTVECPACIVSEWRIAMSDDPEFGYFEPGFFDDDDVVIIDGTPAERPEQWEKAKTSKVQIISIEQARGETQEVSHRKLLKDLHADMYVLDEAQRAKNSSKKATVDDDTLEDDAIETNQEYQRQHKTDMSISFDVSRQSPYRAFLSATVISNNVDDLVSPTICLNAEPRQYKCHATPQDHRLVLFDKFLAKHTVERDRELLKDLKPLPAPAASRYILSFEDIRSLRHDVLTGGGQCPERFLPFFYRPPKEACIPIPEYPDPIVEVCPQSLAEQAMQDELREENGYAFEKIQSGIRAASHPFVRSNMPNSGEGMYRGLTKWIDRFFANGVRHVVVASPMFTQGITQPTKHHPTASVVQQLRDQYDSQGVTISALDGHESNHKLLKTPSSITGRPLTKTQAIIEKFANTDRGILVVQKDVVGLGTNEFARAGIGHTVTLGYDWTRARMEQFHGRFPRPGQTSEVCAVVLLSGIFVPIYDQAQLKHLFGESLLTGKVPSPELLQLFNQSPTKQPVAHYTKTRREEFRALCGLMTGNGQKFIASGRYTDRFVELYNWNWEESFNGNVLRMVGGLAQERITEMRESQKKKGKIDSPIRIADDGAGTFGFHRTMKHAQGLEIHSSDLEPKMLAANLGNALLGDCYQEANIHRGWPVDATGYGDHSMHLRVTSLVLDCLAHRERPRHRGHEMIRTFLESNRMLAEETDQEVGGEWIITLPVGIFRNRKRKLSQFLAAFPYFGFQLIRERCGRAWCEQQSQDEDPFEVLVFVAKRTGPSVIQSDAPWLTLPDAVREGLDFRRSAERSGKKGKKKNGQSQHEEKGAYYGDFNLDLIDGRQEQVQYTADPDYEQQKQRFQQKKDILRKCTSTLRSVLRGYPSVQDVPLEIWSSLSLDDVLVSEKPEDTPKVIRDVYMQSVMHSVSVSHGDVAVAINSINAGQKKGAIVYKEEKSGRFLVFGNPQGNTSGDKYYVYKPANGRNGNGRSSSNA